MNVNLKKVMSYAIAGLAISTLFGCASMVKKGDKYAMDNQWVKAYESYYAANIKEGGNPEIEKKIQMAKPHAAKQLFDQATVELTEKKFDVAKSSFIRSNELVSNSAAQNKIKEIDEKIKAFEHKLEQAQTLKSEKKLKQAKLVLEECVSEWVTFTAAINTLDEVNRLLSKVSSNYSTASVAIARKDLTQCLDLCNESLDIFYTERAETLKTECLALMEPVKPLIDEAQSLIDGERWQAAQISLMEIKEQWDDNPTVNSLLAQANREIRYREYIANATSAASVEDYPKAIKNYESALRIHQTEEIQQELDSCKYTHYIGEGQRYERSQSYMNALSMYKKADAIKSSQITLGGIDHNGYMGYLKQGKRHENNMRWESAFKSYTKAREYRNTDEIRRLQSNAKYQQNKKGSTSSTSSSVLNLL